MVMSATNQIAGNASHDYQYDDYTNSNQQYNYPPNYQHQISGESIQIVVNDVDIDPQQKYDSKYILREKEYFSGSKLDIISDDSTHTKSQQIGNSSRRGSTSNTVTRKITLYHQETAKGAPDYGYGIRVVGQLDSNLTVGRVLWIHPGGPAHVGGIINFLARTVSHV